MKKMDLKTGMWVELRNGEKYIFLKDCETDNYGDHRDLLIINDGVGFILLGSYSENLICLDADEEFDIMKIYWDAEHKVNGETLTKCQPLYWERIEKTYLDDLLEKFPDTYIGCDGTPIETCMKTLYISGYYDCKPYNCDRESVEPCCWDQPLGSLEVKNDK